MSSWRSLILRIGEKSPEYGGVIDFKDHMDACFGDVRQELDHSEDEILTFILQCSEQLPHKISLYGTLIGLLNLENEEFVKKIPESTRKSLQDALDSGDCNKIRISMRFLTVLCAATIVDDEKGNPSWQARADFYITCILSCLPWGGSELVEQIPEEIERVMVGIEAYLSIKRHVSDVGLFLFEDINKMNKINVEQGGYNNGFLMDKKVDVTEEWKMLLDYVVDGVCGLLPLVKMSPEKEKLSRKITASKSDLIVPIREEKEVADLSGSGLKLKKILSDPRASRKECAACMIGLPIPFRYEYLMAETILSQLLLLPQPPFKPICYTLVIIDLCKSLPGAFPAVVAGAVRALFDRIIGAGGRMDTNLTSIPVGTGRLLRRSFRLIVVLSNFQFIWPWDEWAYILELPKWAPQRVFVQEVLDREVRLSYWDKVKQSIESTPALEELLPPKGGPDFRYSLDDGDKTEYTLSKELNSMVKGRKTARDVILWLEETMIPINGLDVTLRVVVQTLLDIGSKSFTHLINVLERYGQVIAKICPNEETQIMLISKVASFWKNSAQSTSITVDRMMGYPLISNLTIVKWVFTPSNIDFFHTTDRLWEILRNALNKTYNRISDLRKDISHLKKSVVKAEQLAAMAKAELEGAESKLMLVDGEPVVGENPARMKRLRSTAEKTKETEVSTRESLESKEALLSRALEENEALFLCLYKNFATVLSDRLHETFGEKTWTMWMAIQKQWLLMKKTLLQQRRIKKMEIPRETLDTPLGRKNNGVCPLWVMSRRFQGNMPLRFVP
ncbi:hypothetical protein R6Q57_003552 [Mikania cordata]